jgi:hypothetical protein
MKLVFKYRKERARTRVVYRPVAKLSLKSADGYWYTFTAYVDSGADVSLFTRGDAELLGINIYEGEPWELTGIGGAVIPAYLHETLARIGPLRVPSARRLRRPRRSTEADWQAGRVQQVQNRV